ncbi:acyltransferase [Noviherbaspirillum aridicola]|uniref:Acyltransferase n=1 Tax=Noviherbaspirillum aridicola TaxID=2849687 RepID=A0ABQ4Q9R0_9BURK|nr:acyltransferase [Noviherbaspirillum aridicola]
MGDTLFGAGYFGVDLFFMISGFIIVYVTAARTGDGTLSFLAKRLFRVVPLAAIGTVAAFFLLPGTDSLNYLWKSLAFIPLKNNDPPFFGYSVLQPEWTLTYELIFYCIFGLALAISHKYRVAIAAGVILTMVLGGQALLGDFTLNPYRSPLAPWDHWTAQLVSLTANPMLLEFVFGMLCAEAYLRFRSSKSYLLGLFAATALVYFVNLWIHKSVGGHGVLGAGLPCFFILLSLTLFEKSSKSFYVPQPLIKLGDLSYSIYLSHSFVWELFTPRAGEQHLAIELVGLEKLLAMLGTTLILSWALYHCIELPAMRIGRALIRAAHFVKPSAVLIWTKTKSTA